MKRTYDDLTHRGFSVWWDRRSLPSRALAFYQEIQDAIDWADRLVVVLGPGALTSDYVNAEWQYARSTCKAVNPIVRLGSYRDYPAELLTVDVPDFRDDGKYEVALEQLVRQLSERVAPLGRLDAVPSLPAYYLPREPAVTQLRAALLSGIQHPATSTQPPSRLAVHGMPGVGKSVSAVALARDCDVRRAFPDGVYWITLGRNAPLTARQAQLAAALGSAQDDFADVEQGMSRLSNLLQDKACLIILDDVWDAGPIKAFDALSLRSRMLITTRDANIAISLGMMDHHLDTMDDQDAITLLAQWSGREPVVLPSEAALIVAECGNLPLALALCGALVREGVSWPDVLKALHAADLAFLDSPSGSIQRSIKISIDALATENELAARLYRELAVFPEGVAIPEAAILTLWLASGQISEREARRLITLFINRALLITEGEAPKRSLRLHDLLHAYLRSEATQPARLHMQLVEAYREQCHGTWHLGPNDGYFFEYLPYHLFHAKLVTELRNLLLDVSWLTAKLAFTSIVELVADYGVLASDETIRCVRDALQLSAYILAQDRRQLPTQLLGRLLGQASPDIQQLCHQIAQWHDAPWLRPLATTLIRPGGPLIRTLSGHAGEVRSVAMTPDGRCAVSGSSDSTVRVWDLTHGAEEYCLLGHEGPVNGVAVSPDGRYVVSGADDKSVKVWDLEHGVEVHTLRGHVGAVRCIAMTRQGLIVSGSADRTARMWSVETGAELTTLYGHTDDITCVVATNDGRHAFTGSEDGTVREWDLMTGQEVDTWICADDGDWHKPGVVLALALAPDERYLLVTIERSHALHKVDLAETKDKHTERAEVLQKLGLSRGEVDMPSLMFFDDKRVTALTVSADGRHVLVGLMPYMRGKSESALIGWDLERESRVFSLRGHTGKINAVAQAADSVHVITGGADAYVKHWVIDNQGDQSSTDLHDGSVDFVASTPEGDRVLSVGAGELSVWDARTGERLVRLNGGDYLWTAHDGRRAISWSEEDKRIHLWDIERQVEALSIADVALDHPWSKLSITPNGRFAVGKVEFNHTEVIARIRGPRGIWRRIRGLETELNQLRSDEHITVWDLEHGGNIVCVIDATEARREDPKYGESSVGVRNWIITPDSRYIVAALFSRRTAVYDFLAVWELQSGKHVKTLMNRDAAVQQLEFLPGGKHLVAICSIPDYGEPKHLYVWNMSTGRLEIRRTSQLENISCVTFLAQTQRVALGSWNGIIELRDSRTFDQVTTLSTGGRSIQRIASSSNQDRLVYIAGRNSLHAYDLSASLELASFTADLPLVACALGPEGDTVAAGDSGGGVHILKLA